MTVHWHGGFTSQHEIVRPVGTYEQLRDYDRLTARIKQLHGEGKTVPVIASKLNEEGFVPPRRKGCYTARVLAPLMQRLGLVGEMRQTDILEPDEWWIRDLARKLEIRPQKVHYWAKQGWVHSRRTPSGKHWIVWADRDELKRLTKLKAHRTS